MGYKSAYTYLADKFEILNDDCDYEKWSRYLIDVLKQYPVNEGLDVGCGSGRFTRAFCDAGFVVSGMDISTEMLIKAQASSERGKRNPTYFQGDVSSFKTIKKYDFVTAINDCFNYVKKSSLLSAFRAVKGALKKDGIFLFDISSKKKFHEKIANTVCADDREDITYLSFNSLDGDKVTMDVTLFVKRQDGAFDRFDERHVQYVYSEEEILSALEKTGFETVRVQGHLGEDKETSDRICFLARRK